MSDLRRRRTASDRLFGALLLLYPAAFRSRFGDDMRELFRDQVAHARRTAGTRGVLRLWTRSLPSLVTNALLERRTARAEHARTAARMVHWTGSPAMLETLGADLRYAARMLRRSPVFATVAVLVIALGAGAVTTVFSAMNALVLRPLPGAGHAERLLEIQRTNPDPRDASRVSASRGFVDALRGGTRTTSGIAAWMFVDVTLGTRTGAMQAQASLASGEYFDVLQVRPALGRFFTPDEDREPGAHPVIVVSHAFWRTALGGDSSVVGRPIMVSGRPYTVVGVAPASFRGIFTPVVVDAWIPLAMRVHVWPDQGDASAPSYRVFGRLRDGVSEATARAELSSIVAAYARAGSEPEWLRHFSAVDTYQMTGLPSDARNAVLTFMGLLLGIALLVLLIAGVNVASMVSARAAVRLREMAVRAALGAPRGRLVRQLLTETLSLFLLGALGGLALAWAATSAIAHMPVPAEVRLAADLSPDLRVLGFALLVSLGAGLAVGILPALRGARDGVAIRLRDGSAGAGTRRGRLGGALVVAQLACSLVLLVAAGLFARTLRQGATVDPHFDARGVSVAYLNAQSWSWDEARAREALPRMLDRAAAAPGIAGAATASYLPLTLTSEGESAEFAGEAQPTNLLQVAVSPSYFDVLRLPIVRGRAFAASDGAGAPRVAIVNETLARAHWPRGEAIGRTFTWQKQPVTIVGIARDSKYENLTEHGRQLAYFPIAQQWRMRQVLMVRTVAGDVATGRAAIEAAVRDVDPLLPRPTVTALREQQAIVLLPQRIASLVTGALGATGLLLAAVGLYGVIAYSAARRTREMGIRIALGACRADVLALVVREGMGLAVGGVLVGLALAMLSARLLASYLVGVSPLDPLTFGGMTVVFVGVALVASWLPARRAAGVEPVVALKAE